MKKEKRESTKSSDSRGALTRYIQKFIGFKGLTFVIASVALFTGHLIGAVWAGVAMAVSGLKSWEDERRR